MSHAALVDAFGRVFELCRLRPGETAAILTDGPPPGPYVQVAQQAFARLGVPAFHVDVSATAQGGDSIPTPGAIGDLLSAHPGALAALTECDFVLDLVTTRLGGLIHDASRPALMEAGIRLLHVHEPPDVLLRQVPTVELRDRCLRAVERMRAASELRVTSRFGTDLRVDLAGAQVNAFYGYSERPGHVNAWPGGFVAGYPVTGTAAGRVVFAPGDLNLTTMRYFESPVTLHWEQDHIERIDGEGIDAELLRDYMAVWDEPQAYGLSHVGWGLNRDARWWAMALQHPVVGDFSEGRSFAGSFMISTGSNRPAGRATRCHFDLPMRNCTVLLDGEAVVSEGVLTEEPEVAGTLAT